ncbi:TetR/AcrR family transcriptional regulator [Clostridium magnum]|uniref:Fatty acid metabolism regulator protein n=1 Tax=Clostridium magnum DSM 2767 TaxID=1121326 RepID=A0A161XEB9_9CLOT|nr:TetR/AcrR family transcriptional regulator [Clostridium magnum]KZL92746.1 fatty acid metabolism regulator protein [Clostridium magnum DSM 2767]SHI24926.1 transcriptional regulator, TetR family [Clostridium magnum DSM 2767]
MNQGLNRRESITLSAIEIIDELGIQGFSIRELAKRQGIKEAAIYRHFESKQDIVISVLKIFSDFVQNVIHSINEKKLNPKESIVFFIQSHTEFFEEYPSVTSIVFSEEIFRDNDIVATEMKDIFKMRSNYIVHLVERAQTFGEISTKFTCEELADLILGLLRRLTMKWRINGYNFPLTEKVLLILEKLF